MRKASKQQTLAQLAKLIKQGFAAVDKRFTSVDQRFTSINHQLIQLTGETTYTRKGVESLRSELGSLRSELNQRFDKNDKDHEEIVETLKEFISGGYDLLDKRVAKLEHHAFASS